MIFIIGSVILFTLGFFGILLFKEKIKIFFSLNFMQTGLLFFLFAAGEPNVKRVPVLEVFDGIDKINNSIISMYGFIMILFFFVFNILLLYYLKKDYIVEEDIDRVQK